MPTTSTIVSTIAFMLAACAQGGSGEPGDGGNGGTDAKPVDGSMQPHNDAPVQPSDASVDGGILSDGPLPDGLPGGSNFLCDDSTQCTSGECCFDFLGASEQGFCVQGTLVLNVCIPPLE